MPIVFVHGVNTRESDPTYAANAAARGKLFRRLIGNPLSKRGARFARLEIVDAYWGNHGVGFAWNLETLPDVRTIEHLGPDGNEVSESDIEFVHTVQQLAGRPSMSGGVEELGGTDGLLRAAATNDQGPFLEAVLGPVTMSEIRLRGDATTADEEGTFQALLAIAVDQVSNDPGLPAAVRSMPSDSALMDFLKTAVRRRFEELLVEELGADQDVPEGIETLGFHDRFSDIFDCISEAFQRVEDAPARVASVPVLDIIRAGTHRTLARFVGDIFVYLNERGARDQPGPIVQAVMTAIKDARLARPDDPMIVVTHSMGGNIVYDILTYYDPTLMVDALVTVGGQVGQFEEMKIFRQSDKAVRAPARLTGLKPRVGYWLNIYDPADLFGFKVAPVFADVDADVPYLTGAGGMKAHSAYFARASFYRLLLAHLEEAL